jgi:hypothetical protein
MSFWHFTFVGHFDLRMLGFLINPREDSLAENVIPAREIDPARVEKLLDEYPAEVAAHVRLNDGYAVCQTYGFGPHGHEAYEFAIRLAQEEDCMAVTSGTGVNYPPEAVEAQRKRWEEAEKARQKVLDEQEKIYPSLKKIISGGQIGAERAALDIAKWILISHGGWVPKGRIPVERNSDPNKYKMMEMDTTSYSKCSEQNVIDSDGTLLLSHGKLTGRSDFTRKMAIKHSKPWLHIDLNQTAHSPVSEKIAEFLKQYRIEVLNVSGPITFEDWKIYRAVRTLIQSAYYLQKHERASIFESKTW